MICTIRTFRSNTHKEVLMNAKQKIHQAKLNHWMSLFQQQAASGLTIRQWCEQNNCSFHSFNYWKHILKEEYTDSVLPDIVPVFQKPPALSDISPSSALMPQTISNISCDSYNSLEVNHSSKVCITVGDMEISIGSSTSDEMVLKILRAIRYA